MKKVGHGGVIRFLHSDIPVKVHSPTLPCLVDG